MFLMAAAIVVAAGTVSHTNRDCADSVHPGGSWVMNRADRQRNHIEEGQHASVFRNGI